MKNFQYFRIIIVLICCLSFVFNSCVKQEFAEPSPSVPNAQLTANTTIAKLLERHPYPAHKNRLDSILGDTIIQGVVTGNDESGNIYKQMIIQDGTAGILINVDMGNYCNEYKVGQKIYIKCKGLVLGDYSGLPQLGLPYIDKPWGPWKVGRIPSGYIQKYLFKDGMPNDTLKPKEITSFNQITMSDINRFVTFKNVSFPETGLAYTEKYFTTDRLLIDSSGASIKVRTSNYANFATDILPEGAGKITGILGYYASGTRFTYQLAVRNKKEIGPFYPTINTIETFASSLGSFTQFSVSGNEKWTQATHSGKTYANMTGYSAGPPPTYSANEDWLISKAYDFSKFTVKKFSFESARNYGTAGDNSLKVFYSTNYSGTGTPTAAVWTELTGIPISTGSWTWVPSGDIDLSSINATKVFIAFQYKCSASSVPTWEITSVKLSGY